MLVDVTGDQLLYKVYMTNHFGETLQIIVDHPQFALVVVGLN